MSIITISRMYGSGGSEVAALVASALDWQLLDNALVDAVAERLGVPPAEVEEREERVATLVERLAASLALSAPEILPGPSTATLPPSEERLIAVTERIIHEACARGNVVLVGRGAQSMLAARSDVIHAYCYAPPAALAARTAERYGMSLKDAARQVEEHNRQREQHVRKYWKRSWSAFENYHLCLNTDWLGLEGAAEIIVRLARQKFGPASSESPGMLGSASS
ncbi:MAG TPA: cytidylate kinase-like family protein [Gemmatimonadaceae bacterium]|nr:cytidylate kinase-like family protein [Gemmatimonadaceae bacterium]